MLQQLTKMFTKINTIECFRSIQKGTKCSPIVNSVFMLKNSYCLSVCLSQLSTAAAALTAAWVVLSSNCEQSYVI